MKTATILGLVTLAALGTACYADDSSKDTRLEALTSTQLGEYSLKLQTDEPKSGRVPDPAGLTPLKEDTVMPFIGFRLSRPLPENFWNFAR